MPLLSTSEALCVSDSFLLTLYGEEMFRKWRELKDEMKFTTEREYVSWLVDVANHYRSEDPVMTTEGSVDVDYSQDVNVVKCEATLYKQPSSAVSEGSSPNVGASVKAEGNGYQHFYKQGRPNYTELTTTSNKVQVQGTTSNPDRKRVRATDESSWRDTNLAESVLTLSPDEKRITMEDDTVASPNYATNNEGGDLVAAVTAAAAAAGHSKPYSCPHCDHTCAQRCHLQKHLIGRHGYTSRHSCQACGKYFHVPSSLHKHVTNCKGKREEEGDGVAVVAGTGTGAGAAVSTGVSTGTGVGVGVSTGIGVNAGEGARRARVEYLT